VFAKTDRVLTATEEFALEPSMRAAIYSAFYLGWLFGDPFFGWIADAWGEIFS
jgi:MFS family permease